jgi:hypothetical protein
MLTGLIRRHLHREREVILRHVLAVRGLMGLLMKPRNTGLGWTPDEIAQVRAHLRALAWLVPSLLVFLLPGGLFLLPILTEVLDRRPRRPRSPAPSPIHVALRDRPGPPVATARGAARHGVSSHS